MTRIWVYSAGDIWDAAGESEKRFASEVADWLEGDLRQSGVVDCAVKGWAPFRSEREHRGEPQAIVLLVGDWRRFTRRDYFAVANALALHESGLARRCQSSTAEWRLRLKAMRGLSATGCYGSAWSASQR